MQVKSCWNGSAQDYAARVEPEQNHGLVLDSAALIRHAAAAGYTVSARMLETLRAQELVPRPVRSAYRGRTPVWTYPEGADQQLTALLSWREHTTDPNLLRVLLWLDGFSIPHDTVRTALVESLQTVLDTIDQEITTQARRHGLDAETDRDEALALTAGALAAKRGPKAIPRRARVVAADRTNALKLMLRTFALGEQVEVTPEEATTVERVLGTSPNGRRQSVPGADPWLTGPAEDLFTTANIASIPAALQATRDATETELESARAIVFALFRYLPLAARMMGALFNDENYAGLGGLRHLDRDPEMVLLMVPMITSMLRAGWQQQLHELTVSLGDMPRLTEQAREVVDQPARTIEANLSGKPADIQQYARRILDAEINGDFDLPHP